MPKSPVRSPRLWPESRDAAIQWPKADGIEAYFHYLPLHSSPAGKRLGSAPLGAPETDRVSQCLLRLPLYPGLSHEQQQLVIDRLSAFITQPSSRFHSHFV